MSKEKTLSMRATIWLAMGLAVSSSMLGTAGWQGYRLYHQSRITETIRAHAIAEAYAAQLSPYMSREQRRELVNHLERLPWHADSRILAVFDASGEAVAWRGATANIKQQLRQMGKSADSVWHARIPGENNDREFTVAAVPIRLRDTPTVIGRLVYAMTEPTGATADQEGWLFFPYILGVGATGMVLGFFWLKRGVLDPLAELASIQAPDGPEGLSQPLPVERSDEIGQLARNLSTLQLGLEEWRDRAARLERSIDDRVAHETERITRELKNVQKKIWTDPLTRLSNRRLLDEKFEEIFNAQRNSHKDLSIVMLDIDYFKQMNDSMGHQAGDDLLRFAGELLRQCLREQDIAVRYGGDEFVLILPSVSAEQARAIAERTIAMFAQRTKVLPLVKRPTMSAGIASLTAHRPLTAERLLQMADSALYQAKFTGKNHTSIYSRELLQVASVKA